MTTKEQTLQQRGYSYPYYDLLVQILLYGYGMVPTGDLTGQNDTKMINAAINSARDNGGQVFLGPFDFYIQDPGLSLDYTGVTPQSSSGKPYGFRAPPIKGSGKMQTRLNQVAGSTGNVMSIIGKLGNNAGPAQNNKVSGLKFADLTIIGVSTGAHGLSVESCFDSSFSDLFITNCGGSGIYNNRVANVPSNDEFAYDLEWRNIRMNVNGRYGFETGTTNAINGSFYNCDFIANTLGGALVCASNMSFNGVCTFQGNAQGSATGFGIRSVQATGSSTNNNLTFYNARFEKNGAPGAFDAQIDYCEGGAFYGCAFYSTQGEHSIGIGTLGSGQTIHNWYVDPACYFTGDSATTTQMAVVVGSDSDGFSWNNARVNYGAYASGATTLSGVITSGGSHSSFIDNRNGVWNRSGSYDFNGYGGALSAPAAGIVRFDSGTSLAVAGMGQLVARFPTGATQVIVSEPELGSDPGRVVWSTVQPATGTWTQGDVCWKKNAAVGQPNGWRCTVTGTPGTWVAMANL